MEKVYCNKLAELKREKKFLEKNLNVKLSINGRLITIKGALLDEYEALRVLDAINLGFSARTASLIKDENFIFEKVNIKDFTRRKNLEVVRGRLIGTHGKTKSAIEQISHCVIKLHDNTVGIIGPAENIEYAIIGITNLIKGTKQANVYKYLERINTKRKNKL